MESNGFKISSFGSFNEKSDPVVASIDSKSTINSVKNMIRKTKSDMVFISCTSIKFGQGARVVNILFWARAITHVFVYRRLYVH